MMYSDMTYDDIVRELKRLDNEYLTYSNSMRDENAPYRERIFSAGLAIQSLQALQELSNRYPQISRRLPEGTLHDCSNQAIYHVYERQRQIYKDELKKLRSHIKDGTYNISDELSLKVDHLHDIQSIMDDNKTLNTSQRAIDSKNLTKLSIIGTALKYPVHIATHIVEAGAHIVGRIASLPLHLLSYPIKFMVKPDSPYTGKAVSKIGDKLSEFLSSGARLIDRTIKKM